MPSSGRHYTSASRPIQATTAYLAEIRACLAACHRSRDSKVIMADRKCVARMGGMKAYPRSVAVGVGATPGLKRIFFVETSQPTPVVCNLSLDSGMAISMQPFIPAAQ